MGGVFVNIKDKKISNTKRNIYSIYLTTHVSTSKTTTTTTKSSMEYSKFLYNNHKLMLNTVKQLK